MHISKLVITPVLSKSNTTFNFPTSKVAGELIKERLSLGRISDNERVSKIFRKIPKNLKGFVNPETKVPNVRYFSIDA